MFVPRYSAECWLQQWKLASWLVFVTKTSGSEQTKFIDNVDVTARILLSWFRQLKVSKKTRDAVLKRLSEAEKQKVSMVLDKIELNAGEAEAAAKDSDGSESDVDMTFI